MLKIVFLSLFMISSLGKEVLPKMVKKSFITSLELNESLHMNFFNYDGAKIVSSASHVIKALEKVKFKKMEVNLKKALTYLKKVEKDANKETNYMNYSLANIYLIRIINKFDLGNKYRAYYCPMVRKKWIQNYDKLKKVHNPYHPEMPHCGGLL